MLIVFCVWGFVQVRQVVEKEVKGWRELNASLEASKVKMEREARAAIEKAEKVSWLFVLLRLGSNLGA